MSVQQRLFSLAVTAVFLLSGCKQATPPPPSETPAQPAVAAVPQQIGGQDIVTLKRNATSNGQKPEFLTATVLPGRGMNLFQVTANIPGKGETDVLSSPSLADAAAKLNGQGETAMPMRLLSKPYRKQDLARVLREVMDSRATG